MNDPLNQQEEEILDELARFCCESIQGEPQKDLDQAESLLKSLVMSGFSRKKHPPLEDMLEKRAKEACQGQAVHRTSNLKGIASSLQKKFDDIVRWQTKNPSNDYPPPKSANISSATDD